MKNYARVVDGTVVETGDLPESGWVTNEKGEQVGVSNFATLPLDVLAKDGWLPLFDNGVPEGFNSELYDLAQNSYDVRGDHVVVLHNVTPKPARLTVDESMIPADGVTASLVSYLNAANDAPAEVTFTVNGATATVPVEDDKAAIAVTSDIPGPVVVSVDALPDMSVTITSEEV